MTTMTTEKIARMRQVLDDVAADAEADATRFDGQPFTGRTVAEYFGNHGAAIAALAKIIKELLPPPPKKGKPAPNRPHKEPAG